MQMEDQILTPSCDICKDVAFCLDKYPSLCEPQNFKDYHLNVSQEYLLKYISGLMCKCRLSQHCEIHEKLKRYHINAEKVWEKATLSQDLFCNLNNCLKRQVINNYLVKIRDILIKEKPINILNFYCIQKVVDLELSQCMNFESCPDFEFNLSIVTRLLSEKITIREAQALIFNYKNAEIADRLIFYIDTMPKPEFHSMGLYTPNGNKLIYLDSNIFMEFEKMPEGSTLWQAIEQSIEHCDYYYSPSHLEDISKRELSHEPINPLLSTIEKITSGLFIHRMDSTVRFDYESPSSSYQRFNNENSKQISKLVEERRINMLQSGDLFSPQYQTKGHKQGINNKDLFGRDCELLEVALKQIGATFTLSDIKDLDIKNIEYKDLNDIIYKLFEAMDILNYWHESLKNKQRLRSSIHDIEHLIYAIYSNIFVTNDKRLYNRSKAILAYIAPDIYVMSLNEFQDFLRKE